MNVTELIKTAMTLRDAHDRILGPGRSYPISAVTSEMNELLHDRNKEELSDVAWTTQAYLYGKGLLPGGMPALGEPSIEKYLKREDFIRGELEPHGLRYSHEIKQGGSNWVKPEKVVKAFAAAGKRLTPEQAEAISGRYRKTLES